MRTPISLNVLVINDKQCKKIDKNHTLLCLHNTTSTLFSCKRLFMSYLPTLSNKQELLGEVMQPMNLPQHVIHLRDFPFVLGGEPRQDNIAQCFHISSLLRANPPNLPSQTLIMLKQLLKLLENPPSQDYMWIYMCPSNSLTSCPFLSLQDFVQWYIVMNWVDHYNI